MSDYIDRLDAIIAVNGVLANHIPTLLPQYEDIPLKCAQAIMKIPSAEVEPVKRGKWIYDNQFHWYRASCSECGYKRVTDIKAEKWNGWKYCPDCGAKMGTEEGV